MKGLRGYPLNEVHSFRQMTPGMMNLDLRSKQITYEFYSRSEKTPLFQWGCDHQSSILPIQSADLARRCKEMHREPESFNLWYPSWRAKEVSGCKGHGFRLIIPGILTLDLAPKENANLWGHHHQRSILSIPCGHLAMRKQLSANQGHLVYPSISENNKKWQHFFLN